MLRSYLHLLRRNRNFRLLWYAQVVSEMGDWFYTLAVYDLLLKLTGNRAESIGLAVVLQVLPLTFASPTAGVVNDRISRKAIMIGADVARFFIVLGMLLVRTPGMVWFVYPLLLLETIGVAFFEPAHSAVIPNIVEADDVLTANTIASITWCFCLAAGASLGGIAAVWLGREAVFVLNAISFLGSAWLIRRMRFVEPHTEGLAPFRARDLVDFSPVLEGLRYIRGDRRLRATVFVKFGSGILGANLVLLPVLGQRVFPLRLGGIDAARGAMLGMSLLMGARGVGALMGPLFGGWWAGDRQARLSTGIQIRVSMRGGRIPAVGMVGGAAAGAVRGGDCARRSVGQLGLFDDTAAAVHRGPVPRTGVRRRTGAADAGRVHERLPGGCGARLGGGAANVRRRGGGGDAGSGDGLGTTLAF